MAATINASTSSGIVTSADNSGQLELQTANTTRLTINSSGNVGIGTSSPVNLLTVESTSNVRATIRNSTENTSYASSLDFATGSGSLSSLNVVGRVVGLITQADPSTLQSALTFHTNSGDNVSEKMRIDSSGNVGIGNTGSGTYKLYLTGSGTTRFAVADTGGTAIAKVAAAVDDAYFSNDSATGATIFQLASTERMRITSAGNVGIGVTPAGTGLLELAAGTATVAPLEFTSGTNLTTPVAGAVEYDGTIMTATSNTNFKRGTIPLTNYTSGTGITLGTNTEATLQRLLPAANDTITLSVGTYFFDTQYIVTRGASTTSATTRLNILGAGTAAGTFSAMGFSFINISGSPSGFSFNAVNINVTNVVSGASTTSGGLYYIQLRGILKITSSGTIIPQYNLSVNINGANTVSNVWYFRLQQLDTQSAAAFGPAGTGWA